MTWTNALGLCPRCEGPIEKGQMFCQRCGLLLVAPQYLEKKAPPELETSVLQPVNASRRVESKLPALLVMCAVLVLAAGVVMSGVSRPDNTARATPQDVTVPAPREASTPTSRPADLRPPQSSARTPAPQSPARAATPQPTGTLSPPVLPTATPLPAETLAPPEPRMTMPAGPAELLPGVGSSVTDLNSWMVKLDGTGARTVLWSPAPDTRHDSQGAFWLMYIVYRNDSGTPRSLGATLDFALKGSDGNLYLEYSDRGRDPQRKKIAAALRANQLDFTAAPGQRTTAVLVFDLPPGVEPAQLVARALDGDNVSPDAQVAWNLRKIP